MNLSSYTRNGWTVFEVDGFPVIAASEAKRVLVRDGVIPLIDADSLPIVLESGVRVEEFGTNVYFEKALDLAQAGESDPASPMAQLLSDLIDDFIFNYHDVGGFDSFQDALDVADALAKEDGIENFSPKRVRDEESQMALMAFVFTVVDYEITFEGGTMPPTTIPEAIALIIWAASVDNAFY